MVVRLVSLTISAVPLSTLVLVLDGRTTRSTAADALADRAWRCFGLGFDGHRTSFRYLLVIGIARRILEGAIAIFTMDPFGQLTFLS